MIFFFGENLKLIRNHWNFNQIEFAELLGCKQNTLSGYENGKVFPDGELMHKIIKMCGIDFVKFMEQPIKRIDIPDRPLSIQKPSSEVSEPKLTYEYDLRAELLLQKETITRLEQQIGEMRKEIDLLKGKK